MNYNSCLIVIMACFAVGCVGTPKKTIPLRPSDTSIGSPFLIVADPQIHNIYGMELKQMLQMSDVVSKVAIRPPELNILAPLILPHLVSEAQKTATPKAIFLLGDATNIACSGEYLRFAESIEAAKPDGVPLFLAHGNHDSYLMGTVNSYGPVACTPEWPPNFTSAENEPVDVSWWAETPKINSSHKRNWKDACYQSTDVSKESSSPMNKSQWLAKYLAALKLDGLVKTTSEPPMETNKVTDRFELAYTFKPDSKLAKYAFKAKGFWYPPKFVDFPTSPETDFMRVSKSFIVQSVDFDDSRVIIIDTSVCESAVGGGKFQSTNAGSNACVGIEQFEIIKEYVEELKGKRLVIAGHFPLVDLKREERNLLMEIASTHEGWVYLSAHTHDALSERKWPGGWEINVGSTTDWPMEVNLVWLYSSDLEPRVLGTRNQIPPNFRYKDPSKTVKTEVCRHLASAKYLAEIQDFKDVESYNSPIDTSCFAENERDWNSKGNELFGYIQVINNRFKTDAAYRNFLLNVAGAASRNEGAKWDVVKFIH